MSQGICFFLSQPTSRKRTRGVFPPLLEPPMIRSSLPYDVVYAILEQVYLLKNIPVQEWHRLHHKEVYLLKNIFLLLAHIGFLLTHPVYPFIAYSHTKCLFSLMKYAYAEVQRQAPRLGAFLLQLNSSFSGNLARCLLFWCWVHLQNAGSVKGKELFLLYSSLYPQLLAQCLVHSRYQ